MKALNFNRISYEKDTSKQPVLNTQVDITQVVNSK